MCSVALRCAGAPTPRPRRGETSKPAPALGSGIYSLHAPRRIGGGRRRRRYHQAQALQQHDGPLRRCPPDELAAFSLAILHVDVAAGVFQTAILESAVDENPVIQNQVLVLEYLVFVSSHEKKRLSPPGRGRKLRVEARATSCNPAEILPAGIAAGRRGGLGIARFVRSSYLTDVPSAP